MGSPQTGPTSYHGWFGLKSQVSKKSACAIVCLGVLVLNQKECVVKANVFGLLTCIKTV